MNGVVASREKNVGWMLGRERRVKGKKLVKKPREEAKVTKIECGWQNAQREKGRLDKA